MTSKMTTQTIPTNRFGEIYYVPTTYAEAIREIESLVEYEQSLPPSIRESSAAIAGQVAAVMDRSHPRIAARIRSDFGL